MLDESFRDFVLDQLDELSRLRARGMFDSFGFYSGDTFFAIVHGGVLYFKTNKSTRDRYTKAGSDCFRPSEKQILKNYYEVPADVIEDREQLVMWANEAISITSGKK